MLIEYLEIDSLFLSILEEPLFRQRLQTCGQEQCEQFISKEATVTDTVSLFFDTCE